MIMDSCRGVPIAVFPPLPQQYDPMSKKGALFEPNHPRHWARPCLSTIWLLTFLITAAAQSQNLPKQELLDEMVVQLNEDDAGVVASIDRNIDFTRRGQSYSAASRTDDVCNMQHFVLRLTNENNGKSSKYAVLLDRQTNSAPFKPKELLATINVLHVDADGSPRAYHPEDPHGKGVCELRSKSEGTYSVNGICALDNFASGGIKVFAGARKLDASELEQRWKIFWPLINEKRLNSADARATQGVKPKKDYYLFHWKERDLTVFFKRGIIPATSEGYPCTFGTSAAFPGYFVAATTLLNSEEHVTATDFAPKECKADLYLNAERIPFFVLPGGYVGNIKVGDAVIAHAKIRGEDRLVFGIIGDAGPLHKFGEGSIALIQGLLGKRGEAVMNARTLNSLDIGKDSNITVTILALGGTKELLNGDYSHEHIEKVGKELFAKWGSDKPLQRLNSCRAQAKTSP
jgi:hypothetical protein